PKNALVIRRIVSDEASSFKDLEQAVSLDPALTANILKLANSPYFGVSRQINGLRQALILIGFEATRDLALALSLLSVPRLRAVGAEHLWQHSAATAALSRALAQHLAPTMAEEAFVAGLLHDVGKLIRCLIQTPNAVFEQEPSTDESLLTERQRDGFDHAELGAACLEHWNLSDATCSAIRHHHRPTDLSVEDPAGRLARIIWIADGTDRDRGRNEDDWAIVLSRLELDNELASDTLTRIIADIITT
ncbi:MAG: HDOD domain-containing protein, partial [Myxococcota bacterium]